MKPFKWFDIKILIEQIWPDPIITPEIIFSLQVDVPSFSGSFGILPNHVPALAVLSPGVVTVFEDDGAAKKFFVSSGSVTINEDASVQILAEEAHLVDNLGKA